MRMDGMDCAGWEERLESYLDGTLDAGERRAADAHLAACGRCRDLLEAAEASRSVLSGGRDADLTEAVLARTSGSPCRRAESLLPDLAAGNLDAAEAGLVREHLKHCPACSRLSVTLTWLLPELAEMGELAPDPRFTSDVMVATAGAGLRRPGLRARLREWWERASARPRFTLEAAYVGTLLLVLLFGTPISPLREAPPRALAMIQSGPAAALQAPLQVVGAKLTEMGGAVWNATGGAAVSAVGESAAGARRDLDERGERTAPALTAIGADLHGLGNALLNADLAAAGDRLGDVRRHVPQAWRSWWSGAGDDGATNVVGDAGGA